MAKFSSIRCSLYNASSKSSFKNIFAPCSRDSLAEGQRGCLFRSGSSSVVQRNSEPGEHVVSVVVVIQSLMLKFACCKILKFSFAASSEISKTNGCFDGVIAGVEHIFMMFDIMFASKYSSSGSRMIGDGRNSSIDLGDLEYIEEGTVDLPRILWFLVFASRRRSSFLVSAFCF